MDTSPIVALLSNTETAFTEASPHFRSTTSPPVLRTSPLLEDTRTWQEDQAPSLSCSLRCRKCKMLSTVCHFITRGLTTPLAQPTVKGTRFTTGVNYTFGTVECKTRTVAVTTLVVIM